MNNNGLYAIARLIFWLIGFCLAPVSARADGVVVLNSNAEVKRYVEAERAFVMHAPAIKAVLALNEHNDADLRTRLHRLKPDLIHAVGSRAYLFAHETAPDTPVVFSSVLNWQRLPASSQTYGVANELAASMQLMTFRYLFPKLKTIGVLYSAKFNQQRWQEALTQAAEIGVDLKGAVLTDSEDLEQSLTALLPEVDALWLIPDPLVLNSRASALHLFRQADQLKKPVFCYSDIFTELGATLVMSSDIATMGRQSAMLAEDILTGKPITEAVVNPLGSHIILNLRRVNSYQLPLNREALSAVNRVIE